MSLGLMQSERLLVPIPLRKPIPMDGVIAGAASVATFGANGGVDFTVTQLTDDLMCGLAKVDVDQDFGPINYAIYLNAGNILVYENGSQAGGSFGDYQTGDRFRVERIGTTVYYKKNGAVFYTSAVASTGPLMVDSALYTNGAVLSDDKTVGFSAGVPDASTDLSAYPWDSTQIQLIWNAPGNNGAAITSYQIQYGTVASGAFASTYTDDATAGATITGLTNGTAYQFRAIAINSYGNSASSNVSTAVPNTSLNVTWTNTVGVSVSSNTITKTSADSWSNSGAASVATFGGNGGVDFTATQTSGQRMCGLSDADPDQYYASIKYAIYAVGDALYISQN